MVMKRTNFYFPPQMLARLKAASKKTGLPVSELLRRAVENYLKKQDK
jgi:predicted DNA-binding protein